MDGVKFCSSISLFRISAWENVRLVLQIRGNNETQSSWLSQNKKFNVYPQFNFCLKLKVWCLRWLVLVNKSTLDPLCSSWLHTSQYGVSRPDHTALLSKSGATLQIKHIRPSKTTTSCISPNYLQHVNSEGGRVASDTGFGHQTVQPGPDKAVVCILSCRLLAATSPQCTGGARPADRQNVAPAPLLAGSCFPH